MSEQDPWKPDLSNELTLRRMQHQIDSLPLRQLRSLKMLHVLRSQEGYLCLDLNLFDEKLDGLLDHCKELLASMGPADILPAASTEIWWQYLKSEFVECFHVALRKPRLTLRVFVQE